MSNADGKQGSPQITYGTMQGIFNGLVPGNIDPLTGIFKASKPKGLPMKIDFSEVDFVEGSLLFGEHAGLLEFVQNVYVDNSDNDNPLVILINGGFQRLVIEPNSQGEYPVYASNPMRFRISTPHADGLEINLTWKNVPGAYTPWGPINIGNVNATLIPTIAAAANILSDVASGVSQLIIPANANRKRMILQNGALNNAAMAFNFGAAASLAGGGIILIPGGQFDSQFGPLYQGDIFAIGTNGEQIVAIEFE